MEKIRTRTLNSSQKKHVDTYVYRCDKGDAISRRLHDLFYDVTNTPTLDRCLPIFTVSSKANQGSQVARMEATPPLLQLLSITRLLSFPTQLCCMGKDERRVHVREWRFS